MALPGETEAGSAGKQPCRGIARRAHRDDDHGRGSHLPCPSQSPIGSIDPDALKIPARRAASTLTRSARSPVPAEPAQMASPPITSEKSMCYVFAEEAKHATRGSLTDLPAGVSSMVSLVLDPSHDVAALQITGFNPRPRTGSDLIWGDDGRLGDLVSIRAPARGATSGRGWACPCWSCFNPRPRTGSDRARRSLSGAGDKFQSAPPHGERPQLADNAAVMVIEFQSAPPHGERPAPRRQGEPILYCFNPRPRTGSDARILTATQGGLVSIRAPARGATWLRSEIIWHSRFNPRPRTGSDFSISGRQWHGARWFQSAPPHGERRVH